MIDWQLLVILFGALTIVGALCLYKIIHKHRIYSKNNPLILLKKQYIQGKIDQQEYQEKCKLWSCILHSYIK